MTLLSACRHPYPGIDPRDGKTVMHVPLAHRDRPARIFADDLQLLIDAGVSPRWCLSSNGSNSSYVRAARKGVRGKITIARVLLNAGPGRKVCYLDCDTTNLRRDNLRLEEGYARRNDAASFIPPLPAVNAITLLAPMR